VTERLERTIAAVRRGTADDHEALRRFQTRLFGPQARQLEPARSRWLFEANPAGEPHAPEIWIYGGGEIVGQQSGILHRLKAGAEEHRAAWAIDLMVDPAWRLRGVGPALSERLARSHPITVALGATDLLYPTLLRSGWCDLGHIPTYVRPLRPARLAAWWRRRGPRARAAAQLVAPGLRLADTWNRLASGGLALRPIERFESAADEIWSRLSPRYPILARRDATTLAWRFDRSPDAGLYRRFYLRRGAEVVGYLVLREGTLLDAPVSFVVDSLCAPEQTLALLTLAIGEALRGEAGAMLLDTLNERGRPAFRRAGFFPIRKQSPRRFLWRTQPELESLHPLLRDRSNWYVTRADSDWDHPEAEAELEASFGDGSGSPGSNPETTAP
jgi:GNAT superfamily N-acetyltransferase